VRALRPGIGHEQDHTLRSGQVVTSKDGERPTQYVTRPRPHTRRQNFLVRKRSSAGDRSTCACTHNAMIERPTDAQQAWQCATCGHIYGEN
jgi:hypothetical protein